MKTMIHKWLITKTSKTNTKVCYLQRIVSATPPQSARVESPGLPLHKRDSISNVALMPHTCYSCFFVLPGLLHPASRTKFIFKTETYKLTLDIKGMYLFFLHETVHPVHSMSLTLLLVYQTNHLRELLQSRLEWLPGVHSGSVQGLSSHQGAGRRGNGEPSNRQSCSGGMPSQSKLLPFKGAPWNQDGSLVCTAGWGSVSTHVHPHDTVTARLHD